MTLVRLSLAALMTLTLGCASLPNQARAQKAQNQTTSPSHADSPVMTMHHMHILLNQALETAAEGSNLRMLAKMDMARQGIDQMTQERGDEMLNQAAKMVENVMNSEAMKQLHEKGLSPKKSEQMQYTHDLAQQTKDIIAKLKQMPTVPDTGTSAKASQP